MNETLQEIQSSSFGIEKLLYYLQKHESPGFQAFLANKLYDYPISQVSDYLPQLVNISIQREDYGAFTKYFMDSALKDHNLALKLYWVLQANLQDNFAKYSEKLSFMLASLEKVIVNGHTDEEKVVVPKHLFELSITENDQEKHYRKSVRADYFTEQHKIAFSLAKASVALIKVKEDKRLSMLKHYIDQINNRLKEIRHWYCNETTSEYTKRLFRGIVIPIGEPLEQVVRILSSESKYYKTKARVPYRVVVETVNMEEDEPNIETNYTVEGTGLEELEEDLGEIPDKNEERFKGMKECINSLEECSEEASETESIEENVWGEDWNATYQRLMGNSPFGHFKSWNIRCFIVKGRDDLRQELLAMQVIKKAQEIFKQENLELYLRPYDILVVSGNSGFIECVPNALSIDFIKKSNKSYRNLTKFFENAFAIGFEEAQKNFVESMAAYSLLCYLLNLKDRHNGNILLDSQGRIIHIDFGFFLTNSPGKNMDFETAPFKLTKEMIDIMGGYQGEMFIYYKVLMYQGLLALRKNYEELTLLVEMMLPGEALPCFHDPFRAAREFRSRLHLNKNEDECLEVIETLIKKSAENKKTRKYDTFQKVSNGIL